MQMELESFPDGRFSILPLRQPETESALFQVHVWNCIEMSRALQSSFWPC
jgi:hypothetical protein